MEKCSVFGTCVETVNLREESLTALC